MVLVYDVSSCIFLYRAELREFDAPIVGSHSTELAYARLENFDSRLDNGQVVDKRRF